MSVATLYGLKALATIVFDIDSGQRLDCVYPIPSICNLSDEAQKSIAHLALPHSNKQDEGDTQFTVLFPESRKSTQFLYGYVLFRQQRDASRSRGYSQRALMIISTKPYVDLYARVLRVIGPLFFQMGNSVLEAIYENIMQWPPPLLETPISLPLAGTFISCIIPELLNYSEYEARSSSLANLRSPRTPSLNHFIGEGDNEDNVDIEKIEKKTDETQDQHGDAINDYETEPRVHVQDGRFVVTEAVILAVPSFGDVLLSKRTHRIVPFETVGLYSSFMGAESCLWQLWQLAITGESLLILSPHARTCSQAVLAFTSLIAPLRFEGDYRPYYALYEVDFDEIATRKSNGMSTSNQTTVIGTTNPFFLKSFKGWPNAMVFPFLEPKTDTHLSSAKLGARIPNESTGESCVSVRLKPNVELDTLEESERVVLLRRRPRYVIPDTSVLSQLVTPPEIYVTQTAISDEEPFIIINNSILRKHFRKLTRRFLRPFDQYFGIWHRSDSTNSNLYMSVEDSFKDFDPQQFLASINVHELPSQLRRSKWRSLYTEFIQSPHFAPWFAFRRKQYVYQFTQTLRALRVDVAPEVLLTAPNGNGLTLEQCQRLEKDIQRALELEKTTYKGDQVDEAQLDAIKRHMLAVQQRIHQQEKC